MKNNGEKGQSSKLQFSDMKKRKAPPPKKYIYIFIYIYKVIRSNLMTTCQLNEY